MVTWVRVGHVSAQTHKESYRDRCSYDNRCSQWETVVIVNILYGTDKLQTGGYFRIIFIWKKIEENRTEQPLGRMFEQHVTWSGWERTVNTMKKIVPSSTRTVLNISKCFPRAYGQKETGTGGASGQQIKEICCYSETGDIPLLPGRLCFYLNLSQDSEGLGKSGSCHKIPSVLRKWVQRWL